MSLTISIAMSNVLSLASAVQHYRSYVPQLRLPVCHGEHVMTADCMHVVCICLQLDPLVACKVLSSAPVQLFVVQYMSTLTMHVDMKRHKHV